jgi:4a-hydroxytetrahydrobiopterin dehydratase
MNELEAEKCVPCSQGAPPATPQELEDFRAHNPGWQVVEVENEARVQCEYSFADFQSALEFANRVGALAEAENHHPLLTVEWGRVLVAWWTHKIANIHRNDLVMAAKTDALFRAL